MPPVAGYTAWYKADAITGQSNSTTLSSWPDSSANAYNMALGTAPIYYSSTAGKTINGLPAVWFTSASHTVMLHASVPLVQPIDVFMVVQPTATSLTSGSYFPFGMSGVNAGIFNGNYILGSPTTLTGSAADTNPHVLTFRLNGASSSIWVDGSRVASGACGANNPGTNTIFLGGIGGANNFDGGIAEVVVYGSSSLAVADVQANQAYLAAKWMSQYRIWPSTVGPGTAVSYSGNFIPGVFFTATDGAFLYGYWWWVCAAGSQSTSPVKCALWQAGPTGVTTLVSGSTVTSGTLITGQWNYIPLATPVILTPNMAFLAAIGVNGNFPDTTAYWSTGAGANGLTNGPLYCYGQNTGTSPDFYTQTYFSTAGTDPGVTPPDTANPDNFWVDVQVGTQVPASYAGTYRLWPRLTGATVDLATAPDLAFDYVIATEIRLTQPYAVNKVWFYSPSGTVQRPTDVNIWTVTGGGLTGTSIYHDGSPSWSGAAGSGWISVNVSGVTLSPGNYKMSVFNSAGTPDQWSAKRVNYWGGAGISPKNGITLGTVYAPPSAAGSTANSYNPTAGTPTEPGQSTFSFTGTNVYPNYYVGVNSTGGALYQNYWVDAELTPALFVTGTSREALGPLTLTVTGITGITGTAALPLGPLTLTATGTVSGGVVGGTASLPLGPLTLTSTGTVLPLLNGTASLPLGPLNLTATSVATNVGTANLPLGPLVLVASGGPVVPATYATVTVSDTALVASTTLADTSITKVAVADTTTATITVSDQ